MFAIPIYTIFTQSFHSISSDCLIYFSTYKQNEEYCIYKYKKKTLVFFSEKLVDEIFS